MADDEDGAGRARALGGLDRPAQEGLAQQGVEGLGPLGLHARALAGGQDEGGDTAGVLRGRRGSDIIHYSEGRRPVLPYYNRCHWSESSKI